MTDFQDWYLCSGFLSLQRSAAELKQNVVDGMLNAVRCEVTECPDSLEMLQNFARKVMSLMSCRYDLLPFLGWLG